MRRALYTIFVTNDNTSDNDILEITFARGRKRRLDPVSPIGRCRSRDLAPLLTQKRRDIATARKYISASARLFKRARNDSVRATQLAKLRDLILCLGSAYLFIDRQIETFYSSGERKIFYSFIRARARARVHARSS